MLKWMISTAAIGLFFSLRILGPAHASPGLPFENGADAFSSSDDDCLEEAAEPAETPNAAYARRHAPNAFAAMWPGVPQ